MAVFVCRTRASTDVHLLYLTVSLNLRNYKDSAFDLDLSIGGDGHSVRL